MFLPNRDIKWAIELGQLIVEPRPEQFGCGYDETSIDLHLDRVNEAQVWDISAYKESLTPQGLPTPEIHLGRFDYGRLARAYLIPPPDSDTDDRKVFRRGQEVIVKPGGFVLWVTKEKVGTPEEGPRLICFVNAKSQKARTGLLVHLTAPTIHAGWSGKITLEIANVGPFHFVLKENDAIAQLTVATISSTPDLTLKEGRSGTQGQLHASGRSGPPPKGTSQKRGGKK